MESEGKRPSGLARYFGVPSAWTLAPMVPAVLVGMLTGSALWLVVTLLVGFVLVRLLLPGSVTGGSARSEE